MTPGKFPYFTGSIANEADTLSKLTLFERRMRITTGLILAVYIVMHLSNHALGLVSLDAMESMRKLVTVFWRSWLGGLLIYGSLLTHFFLALLSLYRRTTLTMPAWELGQLLLGLCIIPLMAGHVAATWGARVLMDFDPNYDYALNGILSDNWLITRQFMLLVVAWIHVVIGLHFFLRLIDGYRRWALHLYPLAILIPVLVVLSLARVGVELAVWDAEVVEPTTINAYGLDYSSFEDDKYDAVENGYFKTTAANKIFHHAILVSFAGLLLLTLFARWYRHRGRQSQSKVSIKHVNGRELKGAVGQTILEIIRRHSIPHASLCGGRGRCTTCRVRVGSGVERLPKPSALEQFALTRIKAAPNVRLACQTRPDHTIQISPLVPADLGVDESLRKGGVSGEERDVVAMFVDLRGSSKISELHLPYDVLFILNQFFLEMSEALQQSFGHYAQFEGDGLLALYGLERGLKTGCMDALCGAVDMQQRMNRLNERLKNELQEPLKFGIGIHCGQAIVGSMGPPTSPNYSAIGDCINAAARLESMSKELHCVLVVSDDVVKHSSADLSGYNSQLVGLRGKQQSVNVFAIEDPMRLSDKVFHQ